MPAIHRPHETAARILRLLGPGPHAVGAVLGSRVTQGQLRAAVRAGTVGSVRRGVVIVVLDGDPPTQDLRAAHAHAAAAALHALGDDSVVSHGSAAYLLGLPLPRPSDVPGDVAVTAPRHGRILAGTHRRLGLVPSADRIVIDGVLCTDVARTALDLSRRRPLTQSLVVLDAALARVGPATLWSAYERLRWERDLRGLRAALDAADPRSESPLESASRGLMLTVGLPLPDLQAWLCDRTGRRHRVDFLWRGQRVIGEADGWGKYTDLRVLRDEKHREDALRDLDFAFLRWTYHELGRTPNLVVSRWRRALTR